MIVTFGWPQITWIILCTINLAYTSTHHGEPQPRHNIWTTLVGTIVGLMILYWGGFFGQ